MRRLLGQCYMVSCSVKRLERLLELRGFSGFSRLDCKELRNCMRVKISAVAMLQLCCGSRELSFWSFTISGLFKLVLDPHGPERSSVFFGDLFWSHDSGVSLYVKDIANNIQANLSREFFPYRYFNTSQYLQIQCIPFHI